MERRDGGDRKVGTTKMKRDGGWGIGKEGKSGWKICFWNVAGLAGKDDDFWKGLRHWDVMVLIGTWVEERGWGKVEEKLPKGYRWSRKWAERQSKKGRAKGGIIVGVRSDIKIEGEEVCKEGIVTVKADLQYAFYFLFPVLYLLFFASVRIFY